MDPAWPAYDEASPEIAIIADPSITAAEIREGRCEELRAAGLVR
jgi:hypothetical protein